MVFLVAVRVFWVVYRVLLEVARVLLGCSGWLPGLYAAQVFWVISRVLICIVRVIYRYLGIPGGFWVLLCKYKSPRVVPRVLLGCSEGLTG